MKTKLINIKGCDTCDEVLLQTDVDEKGEYIVRLSAWHKKGDEDWLQEATVNFSGSPGHGHDVALERYICDFSEASANSFANAMQF